MVPGPSLRGALPAFGRAGTADVGLDLGSTTTRAVARGGQRLTLPSLVAIQHGPTGRSAVAFGEEARKLVGRTSGDTKVLQPVRGGVIQDYEASEHLLRHVLSALGGGARPRLLVTVPPDATEPERRALQESARAAGCRDVRLVNAVLAQAVGAQLPVREPQGSMIVAIGGGRTDVAVVSLGGIVVRRGLRVAGEAMDAALAQWLRRHHQIMIGGPTAERIKLDVGAAQSPAHVQQTRVRGRDLGSGAPVVLDVLGAHVAEAVAEVVGRIRDGVVETLRETPPDLAADVLERGVMLTGGGSRLRELDTVLRHAAGVAFLHADRPEDAAVDGLATLLDDAALLDDVTATA